MGVANQIAATLKRLPADGRESYGRHLQHLASMSAAAQKSALVRSPEGVARRIVRIATSRRVRYQYKMGIDTALVEMMSRFLPFCMLRRLKFAMFGLSH